MEYLARRLADQAALRAEVTIDAATDLLWMLCSFEAFDLLHTGQNVPLEDAARTLADTPERALCTTSPDADPPSSPM